MPYQIAALLAATMWALSSLVAAEPVRRLGGPRFCRLRLILSGGVLLFLALFRGEWSSIALGDLWLIFLSSVVGLVIGDLGLFVAMERIGPRRTSVLFTTNAPIAALGGVILYSEVLHSWALLGAICTVGGVMLAMNFGSRRGVADAVFERVDGPLKVGAMWASLGALGQAVGALAIKPVFEHGSDTLTVSAVRVFFALPLLWIFAKPIDRLAKSTERTPILRGDWNRMFFSSTVAMVAGSTLLLYAIGHGDTGVASILAGTTPVIMLPLLWIVTRRSPSLGAWVGALLTVVGTALLI